VKIRIVHVTFGLEVGGQEKLLVEFARHRDADLFELPVVSLADRGALAHELERFDTQVVTMGQPSGLKLILLWRLLRLFEHLRPSVVHTHDARSLFYAGPAARAARVPILIHTRHGRDCHLKPRNVVVGRQLARLVDHYVCVSDDVRAQCAAQGIAPRRLLTIKNGIDLARFCFKGPAPAGPVVAVARLNPEKDVANLVRATAILAETASDFRVDVAGDGPCLDELKRLARELSVDGRIRFLGEVRDIAGLLAGARMFVLPSMSEGIPLTALESMACGLPVVATEVGGVPEVVVDGVTGLLVPPADPAALAQSVMKIWEDRALGYQMGVAGRRRAERCFDIRRMVAEYEALYLAGVKRCGRDDAGLFTPSATTRAAELARAVE
jgi:sugar transferase (PEP-CTERM/EpsH1 system associated)